MYMIGRWFTDGRSVDHWPNDLKPAFLVHLLYTWVCNS